MSSLGKCPSPGAHGVPTGPERDPVEVALAEALALAARAGEWTVVAKLSQELEARRDRNSPG